MPPNTVNKYQAFVNDVNHVFQIVGSTKSKIILGNFNAHIGTDSETWKDMIGRHLDPACDENSWY